MRAGQGSRRSREPSSSPFPSASSRGSSGRASVGPKSPNLSSSCARPDDGDDGRAAALGDPTLELASRLGDGLYVDASGRPVELPRDLGRAITAVTANGEEVAVLIH